jgi:hypothetical protein
LLPSLPVSCDRCHCYFIIYAVTVLLLAMVGISCLGAYFLLFSF